MIPLRDKRNRPGRATEAIPKTFGGVESQSTDLAPRLLDDFEDRHAAWVAGVEYGRRQANRAAAEAIAAELLHARSLEALGMARRHAAEKGPAWAAMIEDAAAQPWAVDR